MGCFGSRLDKRASAATESLNSVGLQFHGGEASPEDKLSADQFVFLRGVDGKYQDLKTIYATADGKATDEASATGAFETAYHFVDAALKGHKEAVAKDPKAGAALW